MTRSDRTGGRPGTVDSWHGTFALIPERLMAYGLSGRAVKTYVGLALYADRAGESFPSLTALAARAGMSVSSVQRGLTELRAAGLVEVVLRVRPTGGQTSNLYRLMRP